MDDFILDNGFTVCEGQRWVITVASGIHVVTILNLQPMSGDITFGVEQGSDINVHWGSFVVGVNEGYICRDETDFLIKHIHPHKLSLSR
jgi:hypothetical protein